MIRKKNRSLRFEALERRNLLAADISMIRYFETWTGSTIRSTDPAGIGYHSPSGHLFLADSEIEELSSYFVGDNIFEISTNGSTVHRRIASKNTEPTGITYNDFDGYFYVTNDDTKLITRYDARLNTPLKTVDTRTASSTAKDPEDIAADPATGTLYVADGIGGGKQVLVYNSNLVFQYRFPIGNHVRDGEGIAFDPVTKNLFVVSSPDMAVFEFTTSGVFVQRYDLGGFVPRPVSPQGAVFAPTSNPSDDPSALALYIVDGGQDNHPSGRVYEASITRDGSGSGGGGGGGGTGDGVHTLEAAIRTGSDDAEEKSSGSVAISNGDLELVYDGNNQIVGLRFSGISIPNGATIENAYVQFQVDEASSEATSLAIQGQAIDNAPTFTTQTRNVSSRARTSSQVSWSPAAWLTVKAAGTDQRTPDLSSIIQEIVNRPGWVQGNALALLVTGTGRRVAESYEGGASLAAKLQIQYRIGPPPANTPPVVNAGSDVTVSLSSVLNLDGTVTDNGGPSPLTTTWSLVSTSGTGTVAFGNANAVDTTATFTATGSYVLKLTATDGEFTSLDEISVQVTDTPAAIDVRVAASSDDAEERAGAVDLSSSDLELVLDGSNQVVGMRFNSIAIPKNATVVNAYVQFEVDEATTATTSLVIHGQAADNPTTFTNSTGNITSRPRTTASVAWNPAAWPTVQVAGADQRTPNIAAIVQQIVNRSGWNSGNSLVILISGTGKRTAEAYNGIPSAAPLLHVEYVLNATSPLAAPLAEPSIAVSKMATATTAPMIIAADEAPDTTSSVVTSSNRSPVSGPLIRPSINHDSRNSLRRSPRPNSEPFRRPRFSDDLLSRDIVFAEYDM